LGKISNAYLNVRVEEDIIIELQERITNNKETSWKMSKQNKAYLRMKCIKLRT